MTDQIIAVVSMTLSKGALSLTCLLSNVQIRTRICIRSEMANTTPMIGNRAFLLLVYKTLCLPSLY
jgi:hypothetical protein